jgi:WD40 repeat protein
MIRRVSSFGQKLTPYLPLFMALMLSSAPSAQERAKIELIPDLPHTQMVSTVAFSSDGARMLSGSQDGTVKLWDTASGRLIRTFEHESEVNSVAISPDGAFVVSGGQARSSDKNGLKLWDAASGRLIRTLNASASSLAGATVDSLAFLPDSPRLIAGYGDGTMRLWDPATGDVLQVYARCPGAGNLRCPEGHADTVRSVALSKDGKRLLSSSNDKTLKLWDVESGKLLRNFQDRKLIRADQKLYPPQAHDGWVGGAAFSPDGSKVVSVTPSPDSNDVMKLWDTESGEVLHAFGAKSQKIWSVVFSPDGGQLITGGGDKTIKLWDVARGEIIRSIEAHEGPVWAFALSRDGRQILSGANLDNAVKLWDVASGTLIRRIGGSPVKSIAYAPDGTRIVSGGGDETIKVWDPATFGLINSFKAHEAGIGPLAMSPDGERVLSGGQRDKTPKLWDVASGQLVRTLEGHPERWRDRADPTPWINAVGISPDGTRLLSSDGKEIRLWDAESGQLVSTLMPHASTRWAIFSPDGKRLATAGKGADRNDSVKVWDPGSGELIHSLNDGHAVRLAFSPDGRILAGGMGNSVFLWDSFAGEFMGALKKDSGNMFAVRVAFSPDGRLLASSDGADIDLWSPSTKQLISTLKGHRSPVTSLAFSPDGRHLISGSWDTTIRVWEVTTGELLVTVFAGMGNEWIALTPEGFFNASVDGAERLSIVRGLEVFGIDQFYRALYRPDLVREKLAGDPNGKVREAAAKLDLAKLLDSGRAPHVAITSHPSQDSSAVDLVTIEARLTDQGGGIGRAEWRINGITVGVVEKAAGASGQPVPLRQTIALDTGENIIELTAYNGANLVAAIPVRTKITWTGKEPTAPPRLFAVVVGINDYLDGTLKLTYAVPDATTLANAFEKAGRNHYQEVIVRKVLNQDATTAKLDAVFADLANMVRPRDVFVFFAAGHGKTHEGRYYFVPYDMRYHTEQSLVNDAIGQDRLQGWFARIPAKKAVLMFDTCEAGSLAERRVAGRGLEQKAALGRLIQATGRATLTASTATQQAYEGHGGHGVFTFALLDALGRGDINNNGLVELTELIQHVDGLVPAITEKRWRAKQYPQMDAYGSNFSLARQIPALAPDQGEAIIIPTKPTHVSTEIVPLFQDKGKNAAADAQLQPFTIVTVVKSEPGWLLVARDGKVLGYAPEAKLHKLN